NFRNYRPQDKALANEQSSEDNQVVKKGTEEASSRPDEKELNVIQKELKQQ
ncbi:unnamed protein product, partial [Heterosigma akashiwo]